MKIKSLISTLTITAATSLFTSSAFAGHVPSIEVKIEGRAARYVVPQLVFNDENTTLDMFDYEGTYYAEDVVAGSYTLTLVDKDKGDILLVEPMTLVKSGHHVTNNYRNIDCSFKSGKIVCLNLL